MHVLSPCTILPTLMAPGRTWRGGAEHMTLPFGQRILWRLLPAFVHGRGPGHGPLCSLVLLGQRASSLLRRAIALGADALGVEARSWSTRIAASHKTAGATSVSSRGALDALQTLVRQCAHSTTCAEALGAHALAVNAISWPEAHVATRIPASAAGITVAHLSGLVALCQAAALASALHRVRAPRVILDFGHRTGAVDLGDRGATTRRLFLFFGLGHGGVGAEDRPVEFLGLGVALARQATKRKGGGANLAKQRQQHGRNGVSRQGMGARHGLVFCLQVGNRASRENCTKGTDSCYV